jgi:hypothetical protein
MSAQESFQTLKSFFENGRAARQSLAFLKEGVEIGIVIGQTVECALFKRDGVPVIEERAAQNPDVIFYVRPETVEILSIRTKDEVGDVGVNVLKEIFAGNIEVKVPGRLTKLLKHGYIQVMASGGTQVNEFLKRHGYDGVLKILNMIKQMRR